MTFEFERLHKKDPWVIKLYERAFPEIERRDLKYLLLEEQEVGKVELVLKDGEKIGFFCSLISPKFCHVIYFAVDEHFRNKGFGSEILKQICMAQPDKRIIVDIERERDDAPNNEQRRSRRQFYLRNGFAETDVKYAWREDDYEILSYGGNMTYDEWDEFWDYIISFDEEFLY